MTSEAQALYEFEVALADMARDLLSQESVQATADRVVRYAVELVDGCEHAGILMLHRRGNQVETAAATDDLVREIDRAQGEFGEGPCFDAAKQKLATQRIADLSSYEPHWPEFAPRARELGLGSMLGLLLYTDEDDFGALNLHSTQPNAFTERSERIGWLLASHAAVLYSAARTQEQLETALATRKEIGEALGIIMATRNVNEDQAFELLRTASQGHNIKIRDLARAINTGELSLS